MKSAGVSGGSVIHHVSAEDVILKMKDDGDFDRLRLKIIRILKDNEELRSNIISLVKQSAALNRPGADAMKPRDLSDAIHQEIGEKAMNQISDGLWSIIRSPEGVKTEITETIQSVHDKLLDPHGKDNLESSFHRDSPFIQNEIGNHSGATRADEINGIPSEVKPDEPPGFGLTGLNPSTKNKHTGQVYNITIPIEVKPANLGLGPPPGFSSVLNQITEDSSEEDPDVPPGFG